jgi:hypothetical protein
MSGRIAGLGIGKRKHFQRPGHRLLALSLADKKTQGNLPGPKLPPPPLLSSSIGIDSKDEEVLL